MLATVNSERLNALLELEREYVRWFYKCTNFVFSESPELREPRLLNRLLRCTVMPKGGDSGAIRQPYYDAIRATMDEVRVNWTEYLVQEMLVCKHRLNNALCNQPYIMALVKSKANFNGVEDKLHRTCGHFNNDTGVLH